MRHFPLLLIFLCIGLAPAHAADAARGRYLAILGDCAGCHTAAHQPAFSGGLPFTAAFGTVYSTNITPDRQTGIGAWSTDQFYRALHDGIAADGSHLYPAFPYPYFTHVSRADTEDLFAYLKSLAPVHRPPTPDRLIFPFNIRAMMFFWDWLFLDKTAFQPDPAQSAAVNRGRYIVTGLGHCAACHTPKNLMFGDETSKSLTGGEMDNWFAANLTGNQSDGLGKWSAADLTRYFATGRNAYATAAGDMEEKVTLSTSRMTDDDRSAIAQYLKSLPPHPLAVTGTPDADQMRRGQAIFAARCAVCHAAPGQPDNLSQGGLADYPKLAGDTLVIGRDPTTVLHVLLSGAESPVTAHEHTTFSMPGFPVMDDRQIADVASFIRGSWGNHAPPVSAATVTKLRAAIAATPTN